jgi:uncharacterized protein YchJ
MPIYYGKSADGSDAKEFEGFHVSSCGKYWGSEPFDNEAVQELERYNSTRTNPFIQDNHIQRNDPCPCGSKKKYKRCCISPPVGQ